MALRADRRTCRLLPLFLALLVASAAAARPVKQYEYEEDIYLSLDGRATIYVNTSIPALVNLRGFDLKTNPNALLDRAAVRACSRSPPRTWFA